MSNHGRRRSRPLGGLMLMTSLTVACAAPDEHRETEAASPAFRTGGAPSDIPQFRVDPFWARELPNNWMLGQVSGVAVDDRDHVWIVHRPKTLDARQRGEEGMCCVPAPPVIELDPSGNVVRSWGGPGDGFEWPENEHGIHVDPQGNVWIGGNGPDDAHVLKFTPMASSCCKSGGPARAVAATIPRTWAARHRSKSTRRHARSTSPTATAIAV